MPESTHYYYTIAAKEYNDEALDRSLDLFSHFFTEPRFEIEAIKREINALDHGNVISNSYRHQCQCCQQ